MEENNDFILNIDNFYYLVYKMYVRNDKPFKTAPSTNTTYFTI